MVQAESAAAEAYGDLELEVENDDELELARMRHSAAHVMAESVRDIFPDARFAIGPAIEDGFYYDFESPSFADTRRSRRRSKPGCGNISLPLRASNARRCPEAEALDLFRDQPYKVELIETLPDDETISTYQNGEFFDLCRGPHVEHTGKIGPVHLLSVAGAYWRGDEHRPMLQRIYGTAWRTQEELDNYLGATRGSAATRSRTPGTGSRSLQRRRRAWSRT